MAGEHENEGGERFRGDALAAARRIAEAGRDVETSRFDANRFDLPELTYGLDREVDETSPSYKFGVADGLYLVETALRKHMITPDTEDSLSRRSVSSVLAEIAESPGITQEQLDQARPEIVKESGVVAHALHQLRLARLVEVADNDGSWQLTPFGVEVYAGLKAKRIKEELEKKIREKNNSANPQQ